MGPSRASVQAAASLLALESPTQLQAQDGGQPRPGRSWREASSPYPSLLPRRSASLLPRLQASMHGQACSPTQAPPDLPLHAACRRCRVAGQLQGSLQAREPAWIPIKWSTLRTGRCRPSQVQLRADTQAALPQYDVAERHIFLTASPQLHLLVLQRAPRRGRPPTRPASNCLEAAASAWPSLMMPRRRGWCATQQRRVCLTVGPWKLLPAERWYNTGSRLLLHCTALRCSTVLHPRILPHTLQLAVAGWGWLSLHPTIS